MKKNLNIIIGFMICTLLLGGCSNMNHSKTETQNDNENNSGNNEMNAYEKENYVPIQEYTGEGFTLRNANPKTGEIAEENHEQVVAAVEDFFLNKYKTEVKIHNIVSANDGVSVFVESIGEPHFYSFAIVPVDVKNKEVKTDRVWSQEGQVENAIQGGLFAMIYEDQFNILDTSLEKVTEDLPVVGTPIQTVENVMGTGFSTSNYFISPNGDIFDVLYNIFLDNPEITKQELTQFLAVDSFEPDEMIITINLYMEERQVEPDEEVLNEIVARIENLKGAPRGAYSVLLHDNMIDKRRSNGMKVNTLKRTTPNKIIKE